MGPTPDASANLAAVDPGHLAALESDGQLLGVRQLRDVTPGLPVDAPLEACPPLLLSLKSMQETLDILGDAEAVADLRQSKEDFASGDTYTAAQVRAELEQRRRLGAP
jgi:hypothetical protein